MNEFTNRFKKYITIKLKQEMQNEKNVLDAAFELLNDLLGIYLGNYSKASAIKKEKLGNKYFFDYF